MPIIRGLQALGKFRDDMGGVTHVSRTLTRRIGDCLQHAVGLPEARVITLAEIGVDKNLVKRGNSRRCRATNLRLWLSATKMQPR
jgi:hypothetical protein